MDAHRTIRRPAGVKVTFRRMKFDFEDQGFERYWLGGSAFKSLFWTQLSAAFAPGEKFFIDSARALKDRIDDPELAEEIVEFCRQEGHHTAQHLKFDRMNADKGIDVEGCRRRFTAILDRARSKLDPMEMLAATCALEHFTACFADQYLTQPELSAGADPKVRALWAWHAAEEAEHRATCYDLYERLEGRYGQRVTTAIGAWAAILAASLYNTVVLLRNDGKLVSRDTLVGLWYLVGPRGLITRLLPPFARYFSPGFHPWKGADAETIARWQADNRKYIQNAPESKAA
jgi:predicted metal-dependent hydrolase